MEKRFSIWLLSDKHETNESVFVNMIGTLIGLNIKFEIIHYGSGEFELEIATCGRYELEKYLYGRFLIWQNSYRLKM